MLCKECGEALGSLSRFCSSCGASAEVVDDAVQSADITIEWLEGALNLLGYVCEHQENGMVVGRHDTKPTLMVSMNKPKTLITMQSFWSMKSPSWTQKTAFFEALNRANTKNWIVSFIVDEKLKDLTASTGMWLCGKTAKRDVAAFVDVFTDGAVDAISSAGLFKYG